MSTIYIRLPSKAVADSAPDWLAMQYPYAEVLQGSAIARQGFSALSDLSGAIAKSQRVVALLSASDVSVLRIKIPPLSASRLKAALPSLVEEQLISDPADCVVVAGGISDGLRTVAVVQRAWLELVAKSLATLGARHIAAYPAQLCLPHQSDQPGCAAVAITEWDTGNQNRSTDITLRLSEQDGMGLTIRQGAGQVTPDQQESTEQGVIRTICSLLAEAPIALYVPQSSVHAYQDAVDRTSTLNGRVSVFTDNWSRWIAGAVITTPNLMAGTTVGSGPALNWRTWRWPLVLSIVLLLINATTLNFDWWRMRSEANTLRATMIQVYKSTYPKETVIIDPIAQMRQKIAAAKRSSGLGAPDDFIPITAAFGEAWARITPTAGNANAPAIFSLEYRERSLFVRLRPLGEVPTQQIKAALAERSLLLELLPGQSAMAVWQIKGAK